MGGVILVCGLCFVAAIIGATLVLRRAMRRLDDAQRLRLVNAALAEPMRTRIFAALAIFAGAYAVVQLAPRYAQLAFAAGLALPLVAFGIGTRRAARRLRGLELPGHYLRAFLGARLLLAAGVIVLGGGTVAQARGLAAAVYGSRAYDEAMARQLREALADYDRAIELDGDTPSYYVNRGATRHDLGDLPGACSDWRVAQAAGSHAGARNVEDLCQ